VCVCVCVCVCQVHPNVFAIFYMQACQDNVLIFI
jgi:hypothetical protein